MCRFEPDVGALGMQLNLASTLLQAVYSNVSTSYLKVIGYNPPVKTFHAQANWSASSSGGAALSTTSDQLNVTTHFPPRHEPGFFLSPLRHVATTCVSRVLQILSAGLIFTLCRNAEHEEHRVNHLQSFIAER